MDDRKKTYQPREAVLVVLHPDGWVEVFAEKNVDVHIATFPCVYTARLANKAEQYVELTLPKRFRDLFWPGNRRASDTVRKITLDDIGVARWRDSLAKVITRLLKQGKP